jgi:hypothetical protein
VLRSTPIIDKLDRMDHTEAARIVSMGQLVGLFAHPSLPRAIAVDFQGGIYEIDIQDGSICASAVLDLPSSDPVVHAALVVGRGVPSGLVTTVGGGGTVATWDVGSQVLSVRSLNKGVDKGRGDPSVVAGSRWEGAEGWLFVGRGGGVQCIRPHPLGSTVDRQPADPSNSSSQLTAMCCHPGVLGWLICAVITIRTGSRIACINIVPLCSHLYPSFFCSFILSFFLLLFFLISFSLSLSLSFCPSLKLDRPWLCTSLDGYEGEVSLFPR